MVSRSRLFSGKGLLIAACAVLIGFVGCISIPLGDPEKAKVDDKLTGAWITAPNGEGEQTLITIVPYDAHTSLMSQFGFKKDGDTIKPGGRFDWKMWLVDIKGTTFASLEMKNPQLAMEPQEERFTSAKLKRDGETITFQTIKDEFVKNANIITPQQLQDLIADNLNSADLFNDATTMTQVKADQKEMVEKVIDAFSGK